MEVEFLKPERVDELERFVVGHKYGSIEQSWAWGELQITIPGRNAFFVFVVEDKGRIVASMLLVRQHMGHGKYWLWCPGGPLLPDEGSERVWRLLKGACENLARKEGDVFLRIEPNYPAGEMDFGGKEVKECYLPRNTLVVDLEGDVLKQMKQKGRYNIKKAEKAGVYVREGEVLDELGEKARFYVAYADKMMVGGVLVSHFGDRATYYFGASSGKSRRKMAPYALQWFAMQEAKKDGCSSYDFLGVAPVGDKKHALAGVTQFKTRFGGERVDYEKAQVFVYRKGWWWIYRFVKWVWLMVKITG